LTLDLGVQRGFDLAAPGRDFGVDGIEPAQLVEAIARPRQVALRNGLVELPAQLVLAGHEQAREVLDVVEGLRVGRLERQREPIAQDRLGEPVALLEVARALLVLLDEADELRLDLRDPGLDALVVRGVLGRRAPDLERAEAVALEVAALAELERGRARRGEERAGAGGDAPHGTARVAGGSRSISTE